MSADKLWFKESFQRENLPSWPCPTCAKGTLLLKPDTFQSFRNAASVQHRNHPDWDPEWDLCRFVLFLHCGICKDIVSCTGDEQYFSDYVEGELDYVESLAPRCFHPHLPLIALSADVPDMCRLAIDEACGILWASPAAAANALRRAVEFFLDDQKVDKTKTFKKGEKTWEQRLSLDARLTIFAEAQTDKPWLSDLLDPIRIIGNAGSHQWIPEMRVALVDCFVLIEFVFHEFYNDRAAKLEHLQKIGKGIVERKGMPDLGI